MRTSIARRTDMASSARAEDQTERLGESLPLFLFGGELTTTGGGQRVVPGASIVVTHTPLRGDPAARLETMQSGVQRAVVHAERTAGRGFHGLHELPAVRGACLEQLEHDQVEGALEEVDLSGAHVPSS